MTLLALALAAALARDEPVIAIDSGRRTCTSWLAAKGAHSAQRKADEHWFWGYITGLDVAGWRSGEEKLVWPSDTPDDYLNDFDEYCRKHPQRKVVDAAEFLFEELAKSGWHR
jgi:hypothetical protein